MFYFENWFNLFAIFRENKEKEEKSRTKPGRINRCIEREAENAQTHTKPYQSYCYELKTLQGLS